MQTFVVVMTYHPRDCARERRIEYKIEAFTRAGARAKVVAMWARSGREEGLDFTFA